MQNVYNKLTNKTNCMASTMLSR